MLHPSVPWTAGAMVATAREVAGFMHGRSKVNPRTGGARADARLRGDGRARWV